MDVGSASSLSGFFSFLQIPSTEQSHSPGTDGRFSAQGSECVSIRVCGLLEETPAAGTLVRIPGNIEKTDG